MTLVQDLGTLRERHPGSGLVGCLSEILGPKRKKGQELVGALTHFHLNERSAVL